MYSLQNRVKKAESRRGLGNRKQVNVIWRGREPIKENPWAFHLTSNTKVRPLTETESLEYLYGIYTDELKAEVCFKPNKDTFTDFLRSFDTIGDTDLTRKEQLIAKIEKEGFVIPKKSTLPKDIISLILVENKDPRKHLET